MPPVIVPVLVGIAAGSAAFAAGVVLTTAYAIGAMASMAAMMLTTKTPSFSDFRGATERGQVLRAASSSKVAVYGRVIACGLLSNDKALLFVRGERPVMDWKYNLLRHPNIRFTEDGGAPPYDYTVAPDAHEDLAGNAENYELLDMDDFLPAAEQPKPMFTYPRRNAHASQQD